MEVSLSPIHSIQPKPERPVPVNSHSGNDDAALREANEAVLFFGGLYVRIAQGGEKGFNIFRLNLVGWSQLIQIDVSQFDCGRIAGLNRAAIGAYSKDVRAATNFRGAEKSRSWLGGRYSVA
jgi:hypothetical protein